MTEPPRRSSASLAAIALAVLLLGCASGRVRGAQGTEAGQAREYEPETKVDPPIGNVERTSGSMTQPEPYPVLEVEEEPDSITARLPEKISASLVTYHRCSASPWSWKTPS